MNFVDFRKWYEDSSGNQSFEVISQTPSKNNTRVFPVSLDSACRQVKHYSHHLIPSPLSPKTITPLQHSHNRTQPNHNINPFLSFHHPFPLPSPHFPLAFKQQHTLPLPLPPRHPPPNL